MPVELKTDGYTGLWNYYYHHDFHYIVLFAAMEIFGLIAVFFLVREGWRLRGESRRQADDQEGLSGNKDFISRTETGN